MVFLGGLMFLCNQYFSLLLSLILTDKIYSFVSQNPNTQEAITISVKLVSELPTNSPTCYQLYNILMRDMLKVIGMKQVCLVNIVHLLSLPTLPAR